jgi:hypothetical protein
LSTVKIYLNDYLSIWILFSMIIILNNYLLV